MIFKNKCRGERIGSADPCWGRCKRLKVMPAAGAFSFHLSLKQVVHVYMELILFEVGPAQHSPHRITREKGKLFGL